MTGKTPEFPQAGADAALRAVEKSHADGKTDEFVDPVLLTQEGAMRDGEWKLVENFEDGKVELYNLARDPGDADDAWRLAVGMLEKNLIADCHLVLYHVARLIVPHAVPGGGLRGLRGQRLDPEDLGRFHP